MKAKFLIYSVILILSLVASLHAQVRYARNIPIQIPEPGLPIKYTPKQIYSTPDGGVIILGDCQAGYTDWVDPVIPPYMISDCGAIKLDAYGNCQWQWWNSNFLGEDFPRIIGIDQDANGRINFIVNNPSWYNQQIGWIDQEGNYSLQQIQWIRPYYYVLNRAIRLSDNSIYTVGAADTYTYPYTRALLMHLSAQGDTLSTRIYSPDSLWTLLGRRSGEAHDMELDSDGMPVIVCTLSDLYGTVIKTDWDGNIIWRRNTNKPCAYLNIAMSKVPVTNELIIGYPVINNSSYDYFEVNRITSIGIDSLFSAEINYYTTSFYSLVCHNQGLYLAGASQHTQVSVANYSFTGYNEWTWSGYGYDRCKGTERIVILPDSCILYAYSFNDFGSDLGVVKLNWDGTGNDDSIAFETSNSFNVYPNPMKSNLSIDIKLDKVNKSTGKVFSIYNNKGQLVRQIYANNKSQDMLSGNWDSKDKSGKQCASGIYFIKYKDEGNLLTKKFMIIR